MSPLDDELRAALRGRAYEITPSPDPLAGIERRARRIRRNRVAASVAGSALAVALVAVAVPALVPTAAPMPVTPATSPSPSPVALSAAFSFSSPWAYRGAGEVIANGNAETFTREWALSKAVEPDQVDFVPLYGEVVEVSGDARVVYAARVRVTGVAEYGVVLATESGPEFLSRQPLADQATGLLLAVAGDEVPALLVVAAPDSASLEYAVDGETFTPMRLREPGIGIVPLERPTSRDAVRVVAADGREVFRGAAPEPPRTIASPEPSRVRPASPPPSPSRAPAVPASPSPSALLLGKPDNLLGWPTRGITDAALVERAAAGYARAKGVQRSQVSWEVLFTGDNDPGQRYTVLNAWVLGQRAQVFGWIETPGRPAEPQLRPTTTKGQVLAAILLTEIPGRTTDELVVVPQPRTGDVIYKSSSTDAGRSAIVDGLDGIAIVDRAKNAQGDRLLVLDGNGDLDKPTFSGTVDSVLCGQTGCS